MKKPFNFARYNELLETQKKLTLAERSKSFFIGNEMVLLNYEASIQSQVMYNRKDEYFLLIENYLQKVVSPFDFRSQLSKMQREDCIKAREICRSPEELSKFYLLDNLDDFSDLILDISDIGFDAEESGFQEGLKEDDLYSSIQIYYSQFRNLQPKIYLDQLLARSYQLLFVVTLVITSGLVLTFL